MVKATSSSSSSSSELSIRTTNSNNNPAKEQVEIQMYLSKLKELVPHMPKNRKVSKLEVIQHVIDYICELQGSLEQQSHHQQLMQRQRRRRSLSSAESLAASILVQQHRRPLGILSSIPNNTLSDVMNYIFL